MQRSSARPRSPGLLDGDEAAHLPAREVHRPGMRSLERLALVLGIEADDQLVAVDATAHVSADHEGQSAEHLPLAHVLAVGEERPYARSELLVVRPSYSRSVRGSPNDWNTLVSGKPVMAATRSPARVRTMSPYARAIGAWRSRR
jgi:hypothetical protein